MMQKSVFVAGLDYSITSEELAQLFAAYGSVEAAKVVVDKLSGQSKGFGFVDFKNVADVKNCIEALNNTTYKNRILVVKEKEERQVNRVRSFARH